jgi:YHS domain-containing protein
MRSLAMMELVRAHRVASAVVAALVVVGSVVVVVAFAKRISPLSWGWYGQVYAPSGLAIGGYDPVSYHRVGAVTPGDAKYSSEWNGARWLFATDEDRALFESNPERYAPQFGGFCSFAASKGFTAKTDPAVWRIEGGRLYLFNDAGMRDNWVSELGEGVIERGKHAWAARVPR